MDMNLLDELLNTKYFHGFSNNGKSFYNYAEEMSNAEQCLEDITYCIDITDSNYDKLLMYFFRSLLTIKSGRKIDVVEKLQEAHENMFNLYCLYLNYFYEFCTKDADINKKPTNAFYIIEHRYLYKFTDCRRWIQEIEHLIEDAYFRLNNHYDSYCEAMNHNDIRCRSKEEIENYLIIPMKRLLMIAKILEPYDKNYKEEITIDIFDTDGNKVDYAIIDKCNANKINQYKWFKDEDGFFYAIDYDKHNNGYQIWLSNEIMDIKYHQTTAYKTKDTRDNRFSNITIITYDKKSYDTAYGLSDDRSYIIGYKDAIEDITRKIDSVEDIEDLKNIIKDIKDAIKDISI